MKISEPTRPTRKTVVFLGAGASASEGAPMQATLFRDYFIDQKSEPAHRIHHEWDSELATFFLDFFGIDVDHGDLNATNFPTFEEVLGILELADSQGESFRDWGTSNLVDGQRKPRLQHVRDLMVLLIAQVLDKRLLNVGDQHRALLQNLKGGLRDTSFISLNYDILIDNALAELYPKWDLEYSVDFANYGRGTWTRPNPDRSVRLHKLHGSLNWLYCPTCRTLELTPKEKGVCRLKWEPEKCICDQCETLTVPIIIPPTYFKALSNLYLREVWAAAERSMVTCGRIVFCGYSFPDADIHVRYLLKRMEINRRGPPPEVFVVSEHAGKSGEARRAERERYERFFRDKTLLRWTNLSFEQFAAKPGAIAEPKNWVK